MEKEMLISKINFQLSCYTSNYDLNNINKNMNNMLNMNSDEQVDYVLSEISQNMSSHKINLKQVHNISKYLLELNPKYQSFDDLKERLDYLEKMNIVGHQDSLEHNHNVINQSFKKVLETLDGEDIDYYFVGGAICYLGLNQDLVRYHNNIDIIVNIDDLDKLKSATEESVFTFDDQRLLTDTKLNEKTGKIIGRHNHGIYLKSDDMPRVGVFLFSRDYYNSISRISYYRDMNNEIKLYIEPETTVQTKLKYPKSIHYEHGYPYRMMSLENLYLTKKNKQPKDQFDANYLKPYLNEDKLHNLEQANEVKMPAYSEDLNGNLILNNQRIHIEKKLTKK